MRLGQVVTNLVTNAAKYTDKGGAISVRATQREDKVVLVVKDNGLGIAPEMLPMVFDVFVQAPQTSARKGGGLGLGLAIVRSLVQLHEGTVTVASEGLGRGAEFIVTLPAASLFSLEEPERTPTWTIPRGAAPKRVLLVDDNRDAVELLGELIASQGHQIQIAFDGPSALTIAAQFDPEVAVLDIGLPVMDGYELAQKLRMMNKPGLHRLIALTGYGQASDRARSAAAGFDAHVAKPVSVEEILRLIDRGN